LSSSSSSSSSGPSSHIICSYHPRPRPLLQSHHTYGLTHIYNLPAVSPLPPLKVLICCLTSTYTHCYLPYHTSNIQHHCGLSSHQDSKQKHLAAALHSSTTDKFTGLGLSLPMSMGSHNLPSPPAEDPKSALSRKSSSKSAKPVHRVAKRAGSSNSASTHHHDHVTSGTGMDGRHKRVWKACERCRMKKTKVRFVLIAPGTCLSIICAPKYIGRCVCSEKDANFAPPASAAPCSLHHHHLLKTHVLLTPQNI
jgi:hypothetical protein